MDWRDEIVTSQKEAKIFLTTYMPRLVDSVVFQPGDIETKNGLRVFCRTGGSKKNKKFEKKVLTINLNAGPGYAILNPFSVYPDYRGQHLAPVPLKACYGVAHAFGNTLIEIAEIQDDGWSFWPRMGATAKKEPIAIQSVMQKALDKYDLSARSRQAYSGIVHRTYKNRHDAWRDLSQLILERKSLGDKLYRAHVFRTCCRGSSMYFDLVDPASRAVMEKHMGPLPPFKKAVPSPPAVAQAVA